MKEKSLKEMFAGAVIIAGLAAFLGWCSTTPNQRRVLLDLGLVRQEANLRRVPMHISQYSPLSEPLALPPCQDTRPPEALATPDPFLQLKGSSVSVSFIVGADGQVKSPLILESGGPEEDQLVLRTVCRWRYRPALCNGVPTEAEARVRFISQ